MTCPKKYKAAVKYQGCPYCGAQLIKEMVQPFQQSAYYRCSWCNAFAPLRIFNEMRKQYEHEEGYDTYDYVCPHCKQKLHIEVIDEPQFNITRKRHGTK